MYISLLVILLEVITLCSGQTFFNITRYESGDEVASSMTESASYCTSIQAYLSGSNCKCNFRRTFSLDLQTCIDYYNGNYHIARYHRLILSDWDIAGVYTAGVHHWRFVSTQYQDIGSQGLLWDQMSALVL